MLIRSRDWRHKLRAVNLRKEMAVRSTLRSLQAKCKKYQMLKHLLKLLKEWLCQLLQVLTLLGEDQTK